MLTWKGNAKPIITAVTPAEVMGRQCSRNGASNAVKAGLTGNEDGGQRGR